MKKKIKRAMTLLEVMIVIFIIGLVSSVVGYNMRGSLDEGKAFKTREGINKLYNIVHLELDSKQIEELELQGKDLNEGIKNALRNSGLVSRPGDYLVDGWKVPLEFKIARVDGSFEIHMTSSKYESFCEKKHKKPDYPWNEEETDDAH